MDFFKANALSYFECLLSVLLALLIVSPLILLGLDIDFSSRKPASASTELLKHCEKLEPGRINKIAIKCVLYKYNPKLKMRDLDALADEMLEEEREGGWTPAEVLGKMYLESKVGKYNDSGKGDYGIMQIHISSNEDRDRIKSLKKKYNLKSRHQNLVIALKNEPVFNFKIARALAHELRVKFGAIHSAFLDLCYNVGCGKMKSTAPVLKGETNDVFVWKTIRDGWPGEYADRDGDKPKSWLANVSGSEDGYCYALKTWQAAYMMEQQLRNPDKPHNCDEDPELLEAILSDSLIDIYEDEGVEYPEHDYRELHNILVEKVPGFLNLPDRNTVNTFWRNERFTRRGTCGKRMKWCSPSL